MKKTILLLLALTMLAITITSCGLNNETNAFNPEESESAVLTIDNCPELKAVLFSKEASIEQFAVQYDEAYVEFEACIYENEKSPITLDRSITVTGNLDSEGEPSGYVIKIGNRTWGANIDESVEKGDLVLIEGRVDAEWTEYYNYLYIETDSLNKLN